MAAAEDNDAGKPAKKKRQRAAGAGAARGRRNAQARLVNKLLTSFEERLARNELKATLGDFIRLLQLQKELQEEQPREVKVQWVEPSKEELVTNS